MDTIRRVMEGDFAEASDEERRQTTREVIHICAVAAGAVAFQPIPLLDTILISPIQIAMVQAIGRIYGHTLDQKAILEMISTFGASIVAQNVIMAAAKFVPFAGWVASMAMAYALTYAIGEVSEHYFRSDQATSDRELREMFKSVYREKKNEKVSEHKSNSSLKDRLEQLREAYKAGLLTEEEFEAKKADLLADF